VFFIFLTFFLYLARGS